RRRRARHPRVAGRVPRGIDRARPSGGARHGRPAGRNRVGIRERLGDSVMRSRRVPALLVLLATTTLACGKQEDAATTEPPTLSVTNWTDKTELFMEYP